MKDFKLSIANIIIGALVTCLLLGAAFKIYEADARSACEIHFDEDYECGFRMVTFNKAQGTKQ